MSKFRLTNTIKSYETDASGRVSLANLFYFFQEAANLHATSLNWGLEYLESIQKFWILSRLKLKIEKYPVHKNEIAIDTWSRGADGFFAFRDYQIQMNGIICANAVSSWMILDKTSHRPCKIDQIGKEIPANNENYLTFPETKLPSIDSKYPIFEKKVHFSDIDINLHVNNGKYVEIICDAAAPFIMHSTIQEIDIQYLHESQLNDILIVYSNEPDPKNSSEIFFTMVNESKGKETCRAKLVVGS